MKIGKSERFTVRLEPIYRARLAQLARATQRSQGAILRSLIILADLPEVRRGLGELPVLVTLVGEKAVEP